MLVNRKKKKRENSAIFIFTVETREK